LAAAFGLLAACSSGGAAQESIDTTPIPLEKYCDTVAEQVCNRLVPCCTDGGFGGDVDQCKAKQKADCETTVAQNTKIGRVYDASAAGICVRNSKLFFDGCVIASLAYWRTQPVTEACAQVFHGNAQVGERCATDVDCAPQDGFTVACEADFTSSTGAKCIAIRRAQLGQACNLTPGDPSTFVACASGSMCATNPDGKTSTCVEPGTIGKVCDPSDTHSCADGLSCDFNIKKCSGPLPLGATCNTSVPCVTGTYCSYVTEKCTAPTPVGEKCTPSEQCAGSAICRDDVCKVLKAADEPCSTGAECASGGCASDSYTGDLKCTQPYTYGRANGVDEFTCARAK
jgi:hypothetical protein